MGQILYARKKGTPKLFFTEQNLEREITPESKQWVVHSLLFRSICPSLSIMASISLDSGIVMLQFSWFSCFAGWGGGGNSSTVEEIAEVDEAISVIVVTQHGNACFDSFPSIVPIMY